FRRVLFRSHQPKLVDSVRLGEKGRRSCSSSSITSILLLIKSLIRFIAVSSRLINPPYRISITSQPNGLFIVSHCVRCASLSSFILLLFFGLISLLFFF